MSLFGVLPIYKTAGVSSRVAVNRIERIVHFERVGHTGTLDPMATGVLLLAVGAATKLVEFSHELDKSYEATFELGKASDTLDVTGQVVIAECAQPPSEAQVLAELQKWQGRVLQTPPQFSALIVDGHRAYKLARKGVSVELQPREVDIHQLQLLSYHFPFIKLRIDCGSGTYVRSLGRDIAHGLGTEAIMTELIRTRVGPVELSQCVEARSLSTRAEVAERLLPPDRLLQHWKFVAVDDNVVTALRNGQPLRFETLRGVKRFAITDQKGELIGLVEATQDDSVFRSIRVFHADNPANQPRKIRRRHRPES